MVLQEKEGILGIYSDWTRSGESIEMMYNE
jgi:hypothetical protein